MRILLGNPPWTVGSGYGVRAGSRWPHVERNDVEYVPFPFFLAHAASLLENHDYEVTLIDGVAERLTDDEYLNRVAGGAPDLVIQEVSTVSLDVDLQIVSRLREILGKETLIALCGLHKFMYGPEFLNCHRDIDIVIVGEYELTALGLADQLSKRRPLSDVAGILFRDEQGVIRDTGRRPLADPLELLGWPARHLLPMDRYHDEPGSIPRPSVQMWASRGCPFKCVFCAWPQVMYGGNRYRARNVVDVVDEMEWLAKCWGFKSVYFDDDTFNVGRKRMLKLCDEITARQLVIPWAIMARADLMDGELLERMRAAGLYAVKYGVESADQNVLDGSGKCLDLKKAIETIQITKELGIKCHLTFMFGLPGDTRESAAKTMDLALELDPESVQFSIATPFPGSRFYEQMETAGHLQTKQWAQFDGYRRAVINTETMSAAELEDCVGEAYAGWEKHQAKRSRKPPTVPAALNGSISIVIPTFNRGDLLLSALSSIDAQTLQPRETIVVSDGAPLPAELSGASRRPIRPIQLQSKCGFAHAANRGFCEASGDYVFLMNDDVTLSADCLMRLRAALEEYPQAGFAAPKIIRAGDNSIIDSAGHGITRTGYSFNRGAGMTDDGAFSRLEFVFGACAAACMYRKTMLLDIGLFDEDFTWYLEDLDLSFRAQLWGYKCVYVPQAVAVHVGHASSGSMYNRDTVYHIARNTVAVLLKNMPRSLMWQNSSRIAAFLLKQQLYHTVRTGNGAAYLSGIIAALRSSEACIRRRKRVLGGRRVDDAYVGEALAGCESALGASKTRWH